MKGLDYRDENIVRTNVTFCQLAFYADKKNAPFNNLACEPPIVCFSENDNVNFPLL